MRLFGKKRCNNLRFGELWFVFVGSFHVEWDYGRHPTLAVNDVRCPPKLLYRLQNSPCEEDGTLSVVGVIVAQFVLGHGWTFLEIVFVVDEVNLNTSLWYACDLYDKWVIHIVNDKIHTRKSYYFVQLTAPFVDGSPFRHERSNLKTGVLHTSWHVSTKGCHLRIRDIRSDFLVDKQYFLSHL